MSATSEAMSFICHDCDGTGTIETCRPDGEYCTLLPCPTCHGAAPEDDARDAAYERAAAQARDNDFADTNGRDWT